MPARWQKQHLGWSEGSEVGAEEDQLAAISRAIAQLRAPHGCTNAVR
jgi:hypothetical protein